MPRQFAECCASLPPTFTSPCGHATLRESSRRGARAHARGVQSDGRHGDGKGGAPLDVAVLGQFKAGKSSMLNALVGLDLLPVGVLPVTAAVTRIEGGEALRVLVSRLDGSREEIDPRAMPEYVSEAKNPANTKGIAAVDVRTRTLLDLPALRLVDTPGLGSTHAGNTQGTMDWLSNVAAAIVAGSDAGAGERGMGGHPGEED